jgi:hypothetical protein
VKISLWTAIPDNAHSASPVPTSVLISLLKPVRKIREIHIILVRVARKARRRDFREFCGFCGWLLISSEHHPESDIRLLTNPGGLLKQIVGIGHP